MFLTSQKLAVAALAVFALFVCSARVEAASGKGTVKSVDAEAKKVVLTAGTKKAPTDVEYVLADDAKITVNKKEAKLDELEEGDSVAITFEEKDGVKTASKLVVTRKKK